MISKEKEVKEHEANIGRVLSGAIHVESMMEYVISTYFFDVNEHRDFFYNKVLLDMNFKKKFELIKKICKRENIQSPVQKNIKFVQEKRNAVAHWQGEIPKGGKIILRRRKSYTQYEKDVIELSQEFMKMFDQQRLKAIRGLVKITEDIRDKKRVTKEPEII